VGIRIIHNGLFFDMDSIHKGGWRVEGHDQGQDIGDEGTLRRGDVGRSVVNAYFWLPELIFIR
jgi:hypothetical protein|tara:strand:- start:496 stop:684 length:189 start_codon:yes stop_codon:yes gene_type:complete